LKQNFLETMILNNLLYILHSSIAMEFFKDFGA